MTKIETNARIEESDLERKNYEREETEAAMNSKKSAKAQMNTENENENENERT